jgi:hypothetical protein
MSSDKTSRQLYSNLYDRLMPGNARPGDFVDLGLNTRQRNEDHQGVVVPAYDLAAKEADGHPTRLSNRDINRMHRVLEAMAATAGGLRDQTRLQKVRMHHDICPGSYETFVETFHDTLYTDDANDECVWGSQWGPPTAKAPHDFEPSVATAWQPQGKLLHNPHEGSITYDPDASEANHAGTYRTRNLCELDLRYTPDYTVPCSMDGHGADTVIEPISYDGGSWQDILRTGTLLVLYVHANDAFWQPYWTTPMVTRVHALSSKNRFTVYLFEDGNGDVDTAQRLIYVPHVPTSDTEDDYVMTDDASPPGSPYKDQIFGKIQNVEEQSYRPNSEVDWSTTQDMPIHISTVSGQGDCLHLDVATTAASLVETMNAPSGIVNNLAGTPARVQVDVSLAPGAKVYSWSLHVVRFLDWALANARSQYGA